MKHKLLIFLAIISFIGITTSCEKDGEIIYLTEDVTPPSIVSLPDLNLMLIKAGDTLIFEGTPVDAGFPSSVNYNLETCESGSDFAEVIRIITTQQDSAIKITVGELNTLLIKTLPVFETTSMDFRIRATLVADAGRGAPGTAADPFEYTSSTVTKSVTTYGLPRIDLIGSGTDQSLAMSSESGIYSGLIVLDDAMDFTLFDPSTQTTYGGSDGNLSEDGAAISPVADGWHKIVVDFNDMTYTLDQYSVGVVGAFSEWGTLPDHLMDYNPETEIWSATLDLPVGPMKFRLNSAWDIRWGPGVLTDLPADGGTIELPNSDADINITTEGNYTIHLTITSNTTGSANFILN